MNKEAVKVEIKKIIIVAIFLIGIILILDRVGAEQTYKIAERKISIPIFVYHNIVNDKSEIEYDYMQTTKAKFEEQIIGLKLLGYHFITYDDLIAYKNGEKALSKRSCLITFDDGLKGVYTNAFPIIQKYDVPITAFIINNNMETDLTLSWKEAKEMEESGLVTIASHSMDHVKFDTLSVEEAVKNVNKSYEQIEEKLGKKVQNKIFTYPCGVAKEEQILALEKEGFVQNLTDNKINSSKTLDLSRLHRDYPLNENIIMIMLKMKYREWKYQESI